MISTKAELERTQQKAAGIYALQPPGSKWIVYEISPPR
jgi:hypothetical protein